tara:strand:- start:71 stop:1009 length:939 start_codon:yes stop_codon:yes gene_type:complete
LKLTTFIYDNKKRIGHLCGDIDDCNYIHKGYVVDISNSFDYVDMLDFIKKDGINNTEVKEYICSDKVKKYPLSEVSLIAPINPRSLRDAYAFRQHVETSRKNRGLEMIEEFDNFPVYYYSSVDGIVGPGDLKVDDIFMKNLDFELEVAVVISKEGKNISCNEADDYIAGFTIMNDFSARDLQMQEMKLNLGPAKGKDFATSMGPVIVTPEELSSVTKKTPNGNQYRLDMECFINDKKFSYDNLENMSWTFAQILERISMGTTIYPGDVIGSGTCATGCFLELNQKNNEEWLRSGDKVELRVDKLGTLTNRIL